MKTRRLIVLYVLCCLLHPLKGVAQDTSRTAVTLPEVTISNPNHQPEKLHVQTPTQVVSADELKQLGGMLLSDAARRMAGITLKDYGGVGGIKTVSARGLGSQFSTLCIDGIAVNDCQNGQVDLGRYLLGNSSYVTFASGQSDNLLQSARAVSSGSVINMETAVPQFGSRPNNISFGIDGGSFGYLSPTLSFDQRIGEKAILSIWSNYTQSDGDYPFTLYYTRNHDDSSSIERRQNSQMRIGTADLNFFYPIDRHQHLHLKAHYMQGLHYLPGPVLLYTSKASEHTAERLFFAQARYQKTGTKLSIQLLGKFQAGTDIYEDTAARTSTHLIHNEYQQQEGYLSQAFQYHFGEQTKKGLTVAFSIDEAVSQLHSNLNKHNDVERLSAQSVLSAQYSLPFGEKNEEGLRINAHLSATWIQDQEAETSATDYHRLSPYAGISYSRKNFTLRYFFKENYRVPNFNELYYYTISHNLRPEKALQQNIGGSYHQYCPLSKGILLDNTLSIDGYYNRVSDKIIAIPTQNMFLWSMSNVGKVEICGIDITATHLLNNGAHHIGDTTSQHPFSLNLSLGYSFQYAVDRTDPSSKTYGHQIPYTPRHSGNIALTANTQWVDVGYTVTLVGKRYCMNQNNAANKVDGYVDQGITFSRRCWLKHGFLNLKFQVLNIFDVQYEVVRNYPMMGRNYRFGIGFEY